MLSPEEPLMEGPPYSDPENNKYLILMTDGDNNHQAAATHNKSISHAFGYASNGRLGATATSTARIGQMNNKTRAACENAKAAGITVYTIAFRLETMPTRAPCWRAAPRVRRKPTWRATEPSWCRPSRRLRAKSRNCESQVETWQGRRLLRRGSFMHISFARSQMRGAAGRRTGIGPASRRDCRARRGRR